MAHSQRLFLGGLPDGLTAASLARRISSFGTVHNVDLPPVKPEDVLGRKTRGFAFVDVSMSEEHLAACIKTLHNSKWQGRRLRVEPALAPWPQRVLASRASSSSDEEMTPVLPTSVPVKRKTMMTAREDNKRAKVVYVKQEAILPYNPKPLLVRRGMGLARVQSKPRLVKRDFRKPRPAAAVRPKSPVLWDASPVLGSASPPGSPPPSAFFRAMSEFDAGIDADDEDDPALMRAARRKARADRLERSKRKVDAALSAVDEDGDDDMTDTSVLSPRAKKRHKVTGWLGSDSDSDSVSGSDSSSGSASGTSDSQSSSDADRFRLKPQFEHKDGAEALELQRTFGDDDRFKLDHRFIDEPIEAEDASSVDPGDLTQVIREEKSAALSILDDLIPAPKFGERSTMGEAGQTELDPLRPVWKPMRRFDPTKMDDEAPASSTTAAAAASAAASAAPAVDDDDGDDDDDDDEDDDGDLSSASSSSSASPAASPSSPQQPAMSHHIQEPWAQRAASATKADPLASAPAAGGTFQFAFSANTTISAAPSAFAPAPTTTTTSAAAPDGPTVLERREETLALKKAREKAAGFMKPSSREEMTRSWINRRRRITRDVKRKNSTAVRRKKRFSRGRGRW